MLSMKDEMIINRVKKIILSLLTLCLSVFIFSFILEDAIFLLADYKDSMKINQVDYFIESNDFVLAPDNEQILCGRKEKYVLKMLKDGSTWLFKTIPDEQEFKDIFFEYKLAQILGLNVPPTYKARIEVNGEVKTGVIQKIVKRYIGCLDGKHIPFGGEVLINDLFGWLTACWHSQFIVDENNILYRIDMGNCFQAMDVCLDENSVKANNPEVRGFMSHLLSMGNGKLERYFKSSLPGLEDSRQWGIFLENKKKLRAVYCPEALFYQNFLPETLFYRTKVFVRLFRSFLADRRFDGHFSGGKTELEVIASSQAWSLLYTSLKDVDTFAPELYSRWSDEVLEKLLNLRENTDSLREKVAITIYMSYVKSFRNALETGKRSNSFVFGEKLEFIRPVIYSEDSFKDPYCIKPVFDPFENKEISPEFSLEEKNYLKGILFLLKGQTVEADSCLSSAKNNGYAENEITDIIRIYLEQ